MKAFWTLYFKELRSNKLLFLFLCIASLGISYYFPLAIVSAKYSFYRDSFYFLSWSILFIIPLIMLSLVTFERKKDDNLLKLFLPIGRSTIILARFSAVTSMIVILPLGTRIFGNISSVVLKKFCDISGTAHFNRRDIKPSGSICFCSETIQIYNWFFICFCVVYCFNTVIYNLQLGIWN